MSNAKPAETRQRRNLPAIVERDDSVALYEIPEPPKGISTLLARIWGEVWSSPIAAFLDPVSDLPAMTRLFSAYTHLIRLDKQIKDADEDDVNKLYATWAKLSGEARQLEGQLGMSPRSRLAMGLALMAGRKAGTLDDLADEANEYDG